MYNPIATYRIQFHKDFTFRDLEQILPYLQDLGVKTLYASPVFVSVPGSTHGYDGTNPHAINPEIGTEAELGHISKQLKEGGIGWLQDIVPNHMAFHPDNKWLMSVLEKGKASPYASYFDISWNGDHKLMVPFLGASLSEVIASGELKLTVQKNRLFAEYYDAHFPLAADTLPADTAPEVFVNQVNSAPSILEEIMSCQNYRLCHWQETDARINYRRFFTVNGLICLNIHNPEVFGQFHSYIQSFVQQGVFSGLRIDHIDGLYDPQKYLEDLRTLTGGDTYTVVEKILAPGEKLPAGWAVEGNTGYDFLALVNNLFINSKSEKVFTRFYQKLVKDKTPVAQQIKDKKAYILKAHMQGELENLYQLFLSSQLSEKNPAGLKEAIGAFLIQCPVYRYYGNTLPLEQEEATAVGELLRQIRADHPALRDAADVLTNVLLERPLDGDTEYNERARHFYQRCMQFTGPLMAKGVEDTLMYTYNRFIGPNDVGDAPDAFGITAADFHREMQYRQAHWPLTINATSTHDTKRGEDARARLNVLTSLPDEWIRKIKEWQQLNDGLKKNDTPYANDEYFIYQTIIATFPFNEVEEDAYKERIAAYLEKALREAKIHSGWAAPNEAYESATKAFALSLLDRDSAFRKSLAPLLDKIFDYGIVNSLAQVALKFTCPGVPDVYQGTEGWDLSLVDPDNRRPVDYQYRLDALKVLNEQKSGDDFLKELWKTRQDGRIKLWLVHSLLQLRGAHPEVFSEGAYLPLKTTGKYKQHVFAFARRLGKRWIITAVPLHMADLCRQQDTALENADWKDTAILLPEEVPKDWRHLLDNTSGSAGGKLAVKKLFKNIPLAILDLAPAQITRSAGILIPVTSLPSPFGIGDFGPEARAFAASLARAGQGYWQLLPINPSDAGSGYSPYSSVSTMAGNTLLISPELLVADGLLYEAELQPYRTVPKHKVDYEAAEKGKAALLKIAYQHFHTHSNKTLHSAFREFVQREAHWLDDYCLYIVLRSTHDNRPWYEWSEAYRQREPEALKTFAQESAEAMREVAWQQFIFSRQWQSLRKHCSKLGIKLMGDLPFYASYDSADVWTHADIFSLDKDRRMVGIAGVPPDYFSKTGQLWGMPTFKWGVLKAQNYQWWIDRLRKNLELYDVLRIDHFRALAAYWEVPAGEETAVNGQWIKGPGTDFFAAVAKALGGLPFIAEDLGDNMDDVYKLRDEVQLPGMKIAQFGFSGNLSESVDIPHNYGTNFVAYTGTHDNNTTLGWYRKDVAREDRLRLEQYVGFKVDEKNVNETLARLVYGSVARMAILPMQDVLRLDESARMNMPSSAEGNWGWRLLPEQFSEKQIAWLLEKARYYNRF
jgi:malto-oligosyltrehalose synthase/4-alpha-glucanotransferase